jgi:pimeloyl-ACP methyl ester carboxylesterase
MDFFAEAVRTVMRDAGVNKATLIGHSMGAPVICRVYKQAPECVAALVSVDGLMRRPEMTREQADQFIATFRDPDYREKTRQFMGTMFPVPGTEAVRDRVISQMLETPQYVMLGAMDGMFNNDQPDWNPQHVNVPVLVINAPNRMWTDEYKQYIQSLSTQTDYRAFDGVGHWLMLEKPAEFNAALLDMLHKFDLIDK